ncbi:MAG TPA: glycosyltransferase family 4 protein [Nitrospira sp.]|nr:glycosyltransferase family 4 protein [Nitrospira sp.]
MTAPPRLLYLITEDWYFWSHRLDLARAAAEAGFDVSIATRVTDHGDRIRQLGFRLHPLRLVRRGANPFSEAAALVQLIRLYRRERPAIVHHVAMKPILYGSVAAWLTGVPVVVNAFAGLGYAFTDQRRGGGALNVLLRAALRFVLKLNRSVVLFQNQDDRDVLVAGGVAERARSRIIPGSGVNTKTFDLRAPVRSDPVVMLASRMLWDKGIAEFIEAARRLKRGGPAARFVLVGRCDEHNPAAIDRRTIEAWVREGIVEWWGHCEDMPTTLSFATIVVLPSYREGLPKILLEAAAAGKALVATDVPGCREVVTHGLNGFLIPARDPAALAAAVESLLRDPSLRTAMGLAGRELVIRSFSIERVATQIIELYRELLRGTAGRPGVASYA